MHNNFCRVLCDSSTIIVGFPITNLSFYIQSNVPSYFMSKLPFTRSSKKFPSVEDSLIWSYLVKLHVMVVACAKFLNANETRILEIEKNVGNTRNAFWSINTLQRIFFVFNGNVPYSRVLVSVSCDTGFVLYI